MIPSSGPVAPPRMGWVHPGEGVYIHTDYTYIHTPIKYDVQRGSNCSRGAKVARYKAPSGGLLDESRLRHGMGEGFGILHSKS